MVILWGQTAGARWAERYSSLNRSGNLDIGPGSNTGSHSGLGRELSRAPKLIGARNFLAALQGWWQTQGGPVRAAGTYSGAEV